MAVVTCSDVRCEKKATFVGQSYFGDAFAACREHVDLIPKGRGLEHFPKGVSTDQFNNALIMAKMARENR